MASFDYGTVYIGNISFSSVFYDKNVCSGQREVLTYSPPPRTTWEGNPWYLTCWCARKGENLTTVIAIGLGHLMAYGIKRGLKQTVSILWRVWKIGRLVFVSFLPISVVAVTKQVPGVGYIAAHLQQKNPFYFKNKKKTHRHTVCASLEGPQDPLTRHIHLIAKTLSWKKWKREKVK